MKYLPLVVILLVFSSCQDQYTGAIVENGSIWGVKSDGSKIKLTQQQANRIFGAHAPVLHMDNDSVTDSSVVNVKEEGSPFEDVWVSRFDVLKISRNGDNYLVKRATPDYPPSYRAVSDAVKLMANKIPDAVAVLIDGYLEIRNEDQSLDHIILDLKKDELYYDSFSYTRIDKWKTTHR